MPPELVAILDVVMDEREVVDQLNSDGCRKCQGRVSSERLASPEGEGGTDALAGGFVRRAARGVGPAHVIRGHLPEQASHSWRGTTKSGVEKIDVSLEKRWVRFTRRRRIDVENAFRHWPPPAKEAFYAVIVVEW